MNTSSLDILERAALPPAQAHAILKVIEMEIASAHDALATKADLKADLSELKMELRLEIAALRSDMHAFEGRLTRWVLTCILGQSAVFAGLAYFFLEHFRR